MILLWGLAGQKTIFWGGAGQELKSYHGGINLWAGKIHLGSYEFHLLALTEYLSKSLSNHVKDHTFLIFLARCVILIVK